MFLKCCITVYRLPSDPEEQQRWIKALPRDNIPDTVNTVVCAKRFSSVFSYQKGKGGKMRPIELPSIFQDVFKSFLPSSVYTFKLTNSKSYKFIKKIPRK